MKARQACGAVALRYLSGTGNTLRVACWMADEAVHRGLEAEAVSILAPPESSATVLPVDQGAAGSLLGLLMPAHGFTAPWPMIRFALGLPRGGGRAAFVCVTRAGSKVGKRLLPGMEGTALYLIAAILAAKGYRVRGVTSIDMPSNWTVAHPGFCAETVDDLIAHAEPVARRFLGTLLDGGTWFGGWLCLFLGLLLLPVSFGYLLSGRLFLGKLFFASDRCAGCGHCARDCPFGAIRMQGPGRPRPFWTFRCENCMRCMAYCPTGAVEAGHSWGVLLGFLLSAPAAAAVLGWVFGAGTLPEPLTSTLGGWALTYLYFVAAVLTAYLAFWWLLRVPAVNALFTFTTFTHWYRRYHEPRTRVEELTAFRPPPGPCAGGPR